MRQQTDTPGPRLRSRAGGGGHQPGLVRLGAVTPETWACPIRAGRGNPARMGMHRIVGDGSA